MTDAAAAPAVKLADVGDVKMAHEKAMAEKERNAKIKDLTLRCFLGCFNEP